MSTKLEVVNSDMLSRIEDDVRMAITRIEPKKGRQEDLGRLTAEAVMSSYEAAAKAVEGLKAPLETRIKSLEESLRGCDEAMKALEGWVAKILLTGNDVATQIDEANTVSSDIRKMANDFISRTK